VKMIVDRSLDLKHTSIGMSLQKTLPLRIELIIYIIFISFMIEVDMV
jgi:hypothetical protein